MAIKTTPPKVKEWMMSHFDYVKKYIPDITEEKFLEETYRRGDSHGQEYTYKSLYQEICNEVEMARKVATTDLEEIKNELIPYILGEEDKNDKD